MKDQFGPEHFLPLSTMKNYLSRRAKLIRKGKCKIGEENAHVQNIDVAGKVRKRRQRLIVLRTVMMILMMQGSNKSGEN